MYVNADAKLAEVAAANGQEMGACEDQERSVYRVGHFIRRPVLMSCRSSLAHQSER